MDYWVRTNRIQKERSGESIKCGAEKGLEALGSTVQVGFRVLGVQ